MKKIIRTNITIATIIFTMSLASSCSMFVGKGSLLHKAGLGATDTNTDTTTTPETSATTLTARERLIEDITNNMALQLEADGVSSSQALALTSKAKTYALANTLNVGLRLGLWDSTKVWLGLTSTDTALLSAVMPWIIQGAVAATTEVGVDDPAATSGMLIKSGMLAIKDQIASIAESDSTTLVSLNSSIAEAGMKGLAEANVPAEQVQVAVQAMATQAVSTMNAAGVPPASMAAVAKGITEGAMTGATTLSAAGANIATLTTAVVQGGVAALSNTGLSATAATDVLKNVQETAIAKLPDVGVTNSNALQTLQLSLASTARAALPPTLFNEPEKVVAALSSIDAGTTAGTTKLLTAGSINEASYQTMATAQMTAAITAVKAQTSDPTIIGNWVTQNIVSVESDNSVRNTLNTIISTSITAAAIPGVDASVTTSIMTTATTTASAVLATDNVTACTTFTTSTGDNLYSTWNNNNAANPGKPYVCSVATGVFCPKDGKTTDAKFRLFWSPATSTRCELKMELVQQPVTAPSYPACSTYATATGNSLLTSLTAANTSSTMVACVRASGELCPAMKYTSDGTKIMQWNPMPSSSQCLLGSVAVLPGSTLAIASCDTITEPIVLSMIANNKPLRCAKNVSCPGAISIDAGKLDGTWSASTTVEGACELKFALASAYSSEPSCLTLEPSAKTAADYLTWYDQTQYISNPRYCRTNMPGVCPGTRLYDGGDTEYYWNTLAQGTLCQASAHALNLTSCDSITNAIIVAKSTANKPLRCAKNVSCPSTPMSFDGGKLTGSWSQSTKFATVCDLSTQLSSMYTSKPYCSTYDTSTMTDDAFGTWFDSEPVKTDPNPQYCRTITKNICPGTRYFENGLFELAWSPTALGQLCGLSMGIPTTKLSTFTPCSNYTASAMNNDAFIAFVTPLKDSNEPFLCKLGTMTSCPESRVLGPTTFYWEEVAGTACGLKGDGGDNDHTPPTTTDTVAVTVSNLPTTTANTSITMTFSSPTYTYFQYRMEPLEWGINCSDSNGYSTNVQGSTPTNVGRDDVPDGTMILCVVGSIGGASFDYTKYTVFQWTLTRPFMGLGSEPSAGSVMLASDQLGVRFNRAVTSVGSQSVSPSDACVGTISKTISYEWVYFTCSTGWVLGKVISMNLTNIVSADGTISFYSTFQSPGPAGVTVVEPNTPTASNIPQGATLAVVGFPSGTTTETHFHPQFRSSNYYEFQYKFVANSTECASPSGDWMYQDNGSCFETNQLPNGPVNVCITGSASGTFAYDNYVYFTWDKNASSGGGGGGGSWTPLGPQTSTDATITATDIPASPTAQTSFNFSFSSTSESNYDLFGFKAGAAWDTDCSSTSGYTLEIPPQSPQPVLVDNKNGEMILCVVGRLSSGSYDYTKYAVFHWILDRPFQVRYVNPESSTPTLLSNGMISIGFNDAVNTTVSVPTVSTSTGACVGGTTVPVWDGYPSNTEFSVKCSTYWALGATISVSFTTIENTDNEMLTDGTNPLAGYTVGPYSVTNGLTPITSTLTTGSIHVMYAGDGVSSLSHFHPSFQSDLYNEFSWKLSSSTSACASATGYSSDSTGYPGCVDTPAAGLSDGTIVLCVRGRTESGTYATGQYVAFEWTQDTFQPTVLITSSEGSSFTTTATMTLTFQFSEPVTGFSLADVELLSANAGTFTAIDADTYTLQITATGGSVQASVYMTNLTDLAGNQGSSSSNSWSITYDGGAPSLTGAISYPSVQPTQLTISWPSANDDVTTSNNLQYKVVRASTAAEIDTVAEANAIIAAPGLVANWTAGMLTTNATDLTPGTSYYFNVLVRDEAGNMAILTPLVVATGTPLSGELVIHPSGVLSSNLATLGAQLPVPLEHSAIVRVGNKVYLIGGAVGTNGLSVPTGVTGHIWEATIDPTAKTLSTFTMSGYSLTTARKAHRAEVIGSYIYVFGGMTDDTQTTTTPLTSIERASLSGPALSSGFSPYGNMVSARYNFATFVTSPPTSMSPAQGYVYIMGGGDSSNYRTNTIERAVFDHSTGALGTFSPLARTDNGDGTVTDGLVDPRWTHDVLRIGNSVYIVGDDSSTSIERVEIKADATLGKFRKLGWQLPVARARPKMFVVGGKAYLLGGWSGNFLTSILEAQVIHEELLPFSTSARTVGTGLENFMPLVTDFGVFLIGGYNGARQSMIQYSGFGAAPTSTCSTGAECPSGLCSAGQCVVGCNVLAERLPTSNWTSSWTVTANGGNEVALVDYSGHDGATMSMWKSSFGWFGAYQEVNLLTAGFTQPQLDAKPPIYVQAWYRRGWDVPDFFHAGSQVKDSGGMTIASMISGSSDGVTTSTSSEWRVASRVFAGTDYGSYTPRSVSLDFGAKDNKGWAGNYGATIADPVITVIGLTCPSSP